MRPATFLVENSSRRWSVECGVWSVEEAASGVGGTRSGCGNAADMFVVCGTDECRWWLETMTSCESRRKHIGYRGLLRRGLIKWTDYPSPLSP
jgi:hypothetical protein